MLLIIVQSTSVVSFLTGYYIRRVCESHNVPRPPKRESQHQTNTLLLRHFSLVSWSGATRLKLSPFIDTRRNLSSVRTHTLIHSDVEAHAIILLVGRQIFLRLLIAIFADNFGRLAAIDKLAFPSCRAECWGVYLGLTGSHDSIDELFQSLLDRHQV